jgi:hypothetical protein
MSTKKIAELKIGDVVKHLPVNPNASYNEITVVNATPKEVTFYRPHVHLGDNIFVGGALSYVGIEKWTVPLPHPAEYEFIENIYRGQP